MPRQYCLSHSPNAVYRHDSGKENEKWEQETERYWRIVKTGPETLVATTFPAYVCKNIHVCLQMLQQNTAKVYCYNTDSSNWTFHGPANLQIDDSRTRQFAYLPIHGRADDSRRDVSRTSGTIHTQTVWSRHWTTCLFTSRDR